MKTEKKPRREMPRYKCHKEVCALKIKDLQWLERAGYALLTPEEEGFAPFELDPEYMRKHEPEIGGYYVVHEDGYRSFSPAEAFEKVYARIGGK